MTDEIQDIPIPSVHQDGSAVGLPLLSESVSAPHDVNQNIKIEDSALAAAEAVVDVINPPSSTSSAKEDLDDDPTGGDAAVAAAAAAVAASLNHEHNDLLLSSEIAQIAAESAANSVSSAGMDNHEQHLASRRQKDRERYASMTKQEREAYNKKRREQYHRQSEESRRKRRDRERKRYHSLNSENAKERNARRASLERERYKKLSATELAARNARRRERAAMLRAQKKAMQEYENEDGVPVQMQQDIQMPSQVVPPQLNTVRVYNEEGSYATQEQQGLALTMDEMAMGHHNHHDADAAGVGEVSTVIYPTHVDDNEEDHEKNILAV